MRIDGSTLTAPTLVVALAAGLTFAAVPACAVTVHLQRPFSPFGSFAGATEIAVDQSNGNVFVADSRANEIRVFDGEGGAPAGGIPSSLTGEQTPAGQFLFKGEPAGVAIDGACVQHKLTGAACASFDPSNGDIYVADVEHNVVDKFRVNGSNEYEYVCQFTGFGFVGSACLKNEPSVEGTPTEGSFGEPIGVAVDREGDVYVADYGLSRVEEFNSAGEDVRTIADAQPGRPKDIALDSSGDIYVIQYEAGQKLVKLKRSSFTGAVESEEVRLKSIQGIALDQLTSSLFLDLVNGVGEEVLGEYEGGGGEAKTIFGAGVLKSMSGIAVNEATGGTSGDIYVVNDEGNTVLEGKSVSVFSPLVTLPTATTGSAVNVQRTSATIEGTVNPESEELEASCEVQYGESTSYGQTAPCSPTDVGVGEAAKPVTAELVGLQGMATTYHYRVVAVNVNGPNPGPDQTLTTLPNVPSVLTESATQFLPREALLGAVVIPEKGNTTFHFLYGPTASYGSSTPADDVELGTGTEGLQALLTVGELRPGTTYHYAVVATNRGGSTVGPDQTFTTPAATPPVVVTGSASEISPNGASISGTVNPQGVPASYEFDIGTDTTYGSRVFGEVGPGSEAGTVSLGLRGLASGTLYHYRLVATNTYGTVYGADETFTTPGFPTALLASPEGAPLVSTPVFTAPSVEGVVTVSGAPAKHRPKARKKQKPRVKKRGREASESGPRSGRERAMSVRGLTSRGVAVLVVCGALSSCAQAFGSPPPTVNDRPAFASDVSQLSATLNATIDPEGVPTSYHFVYGPTPSYGSVAPSPDEYVPVNEADDAVAQVLVELAPGTTYHFAVVANSPEGTVIGQDQTFTTPPVSVPMVVTGGSSEVGLGAATLSGSVDPQGFETNYLFEYGSSTAYGSRWPGLGVALGGLSGAQPVVSYVQNLQPGTLYHYRLVAVNPGGTGYGADQTFTTLAYPVSVVQEAPVLTTPLGIDPETKSSSKAPVKHKAKKRKAKRKAKRRKKK